MMTTEETKKYVQELCDYVGLELKHLIEEYNGDWDEIIFYLESCRDMREIQEIEMYQEFYGI